MNGSAESIIAKVAGMSICISAGVGVAGDEVWRLPELARLLDPPVARIVSEHKLVTGQSSLY
jgi:hypothetical protein